MRTSSAEQRPKRSHEPLGRVSVLGAALLFASPLGCAPRRGPTASTKLDAGGVPQRVQVREIERRPRVALVAREGDPTPTVALAVSTEGGTASAALGALLGERLRRTGFPGVRVRPHGLGVQLEAPVLSAEQARSFVRASTLALATPVGPAEVSHAVQGLRALEGRRWAGPAEAELAACSGDLGVPLDTRLPDLSTPAGSRQLERWRTSAYSARRVALAALGADEITRAFADAVARAEPWPTSPELEDSWPARDSFGVDVRANERRVSVALRVPDGAAALVAAHTLGDPATPLAVRVAALASGWRLQRVVGTTRPRGGCLRLDLATDSQAAEPSAGEVASVASIALLEAEQALPRALSPEFVLEHSVLSEGDARAAAGAAAWQALARALPAGPLRRLVAYSSPLPASLDAGTLARRIDALLHTASPSLERRARTEPGQGELWALLASPCGTQLESAGNAGTLALLLRALSSGSSTPTVQLEPWITPDGVGILAHASRLGPDESPDAQAHRVGEALGRALIEPLDGVEFTRARSRLLTELGPEERAAYWVALGALAPETPSWLEPRGTWRSLTDATPGMLEPTRRALLAGPLRLAVLANENHSQAAAAAQGVGRWLRGLSGAQSRCPNRKASAVRPGRLTLQAAGESGAYIGVALPPGTDGLRREAWLTALMLNEAGGLLSQSLRGMPASARAHVLGGSRAAALVVELRAPADELEPAIAQLRALLERIGRGAVPRRAAEASAEQLRGLEQERAFDPRRRVVDLWRGQEARSVGQRALMEFHAAVFRPERLVIVTSTPPAP